MFAQHMIASLNDKGVMATVMPHGILFRGGAEKAIREGIVRADIIEAIISLPQNLFYGTGIPACILVINKNKPKSLKNKLFFINADAEYGEGKAQNFLRPEDIEKITFAFDNKLEVPKYSRLVGLDEIEKNDFSLNIRRCVDNSPDPEIEDVRAHLVGGVPKREIALYEKEFSRYSLTSGVVLDDMNKDYCLFKPAIKDRAQIREIVENHRAVGQENKNMDQVLALWWDGARAAIEKLPHHNQVAAFRRESIVKLKKELAVTSILDEFQRAGVFVNWWEAVRWDMKAIVATGWTPSLIPDDYIKNAFLADGLNEISALEITLAEAESDLAEKLEQVEMDDEDEDNGNTIKTAKAYLKEQITGLGSAGTDSAQKEQSSLAALLASLENTEKTVKALRKSINKAKENLDLQVEVKRKTFAEGEARQLILQKFRDTARDKMYQYLNAELKRLIGVFENLWDKYRVSFDDISLARNESVKGVVGSLDSLGYVEHK